MGNKEEAARLLEEGVKYARKSTELDESVSDSHCLVASMYGRIIALKGGGTGAMYGPMNAREIRKALKLDPQNAWAHLELGIAKVNTPPAFGGDLEVGIKEIEKAISMNPKLDMAYYHLGKALIKKGETARAKDAFKKGLRVNPTNRFIKRELEEL